MFALDAAKGALAAGIGLLAGGRPAGYVLGAAAILGHVFPVWTRFRGGKGVATGGGALAVMSPITFVTLAVVWVVLLKLTHKASVASIVVDGARAGRCRDRASLVVGGAGRDRARRHSSWRATSVTSGGCSPTASTRSRTDHHSLRTRSDMTATFETPGPGHWELDRSHFPGGTTPISQWLMTESMPAGMAHVFAEQGVPAKTARGTRSSTGTCTPVSCR